MGMTNAFGEQGLNNWSNEISVAGSSEKAIGQNPFEAFVYSRQELKHLQKIEKPIIRPYLEFRELQQFVYRPDVTQGNFVNKDRADAMRVGMSKENVQFILGTPLISRFDDERWDYVFSFKRHKNDLYKKRFTIFFENGMLSRIEGDVMPTEFEMGTQTELYSAFERKFNKYVMPDPDETVWWLEYINMMIAKAMTFIHNGIINIFTDRTVSAEQPWHDELNNNLNSNRKKEEDVEEYFKVVENGAVIYLPIKKDGLNKNKIEVETPAPVIDKKTLIRQKLREEINIARYYFSKKAYAAAVARSQNTLRDYSPDPLQEESLYVLVKSYEALGIDDLKEEMLMRLKKEYPNSKLMTDGFKDSAIERLFQFDASGFVNRDYYPDI